MLFQKAIGLFKKLTASLTGVTVPHGSRRTEEIAETVLESLQEYSGVFDGIQTPTIAMVVCGDSRLSPLLKLKPGEVFTISNIAGMVPQYKDDNNPRSTTAGLEFAAGELRVESIIVMMHRHCGGIRALLSPSAHAGHMNTVQAWMAIGSNAKRDSYKREGTEKYRQLFGGDQESICTALILKQSLDNLSRFPSVERRLREKNIHILGWFVDPEHGLWEMDRYGKLILRPIKLPPNPGEGI